ncbi:hypothetical protein OS493_034408, partial [Desmophyllum pertusum]
ETTAMVSRVYLVVARASAIVHVSAPRVGNRGMFRIRLQMNKEMLHYREPNVSLVFVA